jgi:hypothetical protein
MQGQGSPAATVLYDDRAVVVGSLEGDPAAPDALWIRTSDLPRVNGFELKPHGACRGEICIPTPSDMRRGDHFNITAFARYAGQSVAAEPDAGVWSLGAMQTLGASMASRLAPDLEIPDRLGRPVRLSAFRGRKVLLLTWSSW